MNTMRREGYDSEILAELTELGKEIISQVFFY